MISPLAHIHPDAKIGSGVTIDAFAVVHAEVTIGEGTHIHSNVSLYP
ncbi:MAG: acyl-[acyl-carrier-protein]--UDP-N-acetylglucosamine O-acyltransferase, partial [Flavobacteriales bacterium]